MPEPKARLTFRVGDQEVQFEAGLEAVKAELDHLSPELRRKSTRAFRIVDSFLPED